MSGQPENKGFFDLTPDDPGFVQFSPYQYVKRLGKSFEAVVNATGGDVDRMRTFIEDGGLAAALRREGFGAESERWIAAHVADILEKFERFCSKHPDARTAHVEKFLLAENLDGPQPS